MTFEPETPASHPKSKNYHLVVWAKGQMKWAKKT